MMRKYWLSVVILGLATGHQANAETTATLNDVPARQIGKIMDCAHQVPDVRITYSGPLTCEVLYRLTDTQVADYTLVIELQRLTRAKNQQASLDIFEFVAGILRGEVAGVTGGQNQTEGTDTAIVRIPLTGTSISANYGGSIIVPGRGETATITIPYGLTVTGTVKRGYRPTASINIGLTTATQTGNTVTTTGTKVAMVVETERETTIDMTVGQRGHGNELGLRTGLSHLESHAALRVTARMVRQ